MGKGITDVLGEGAVGKAGVGGRMLPGARAHVSVRRCRLGAGRAEGAGAPDTCWGCELRLPDAGLGSGSGWRGGGQVPFESGERLSWFPS